MTTQSPYDVLGVAVAATEAEIRAAYVEHARKHHPDAPGGSHERMQMVNDAWAVLGDVEARAALDAKLSGQNKPLPREDAWVVAGDGTALDDWEHGDFESRGAPVVGVAKGVITFAPICFLAGLVIFVLGVVLQVAAVVQIGLVVLLFSLVAFLMAPFLAMGASIQRGSVAESGDEEPADDDPESEE